MAMMASQDDSDESLMRLILDGHHQAFAILVRRHTERFYASSFRMTGRVSEAEDLVQDAFLKLWNNPSIWKEERGAKFTTWFYRILVNANIDRMRKDRRLTSNEEMMAVVPDGANSPEQNVALSEEQRSIEAGIRSLPERQATALNLCFYEGLSNAEAATVMGVKVKALESLLMRAKANLKEYLSTAKYAAIEPSADKGIRYGTK